MIRSDRSVKTQKNILIIDDNPTNLILLTQLLSKKGYKVQVAAHGSIALNFARANPPDLILLDIMMPQMDGYEVCSRLKENEITEAIPVIFVSALGETREKVKAFKVGGVDYITKPFDPVEVLARIENQLRLRSLQLQLETKNARLQKAMAERKKAQIALAKANLEIERLITVDRLTHLANRRKFDELLAQEWLRLKREQLPLSLILCDLDYFGRYNDYYGYLEGFNCLIQIAGAICRNVKRPADLVARYKKEQFAVILPNTDSSGAMQVAESIRLEVKQLQITHSSSQVSEYVTLSQGISSMVPRGDRSASILIDVADLALERAKTQGGNCIVLEIPESKNN